MRFSNDDIGAAGDDGAVRGREEVLAIGSEGSNSGVVGGSMTSILGFPYVSFLRSEKSFNERYEGKGSKKTYSLYTLTRPNIAPSSCTLDHFSIKNFGICDDKTSLK